MEMNRQDLIDMGVIKPEQEVEEVSAWAVICAILGFVVFIACMAAFLIIGDDFGKASPIAAKCPEQPTQGHGGGGNSAP